ncbi:MAG: DNRLRE domain-containing protein [Verrucomicrobia bacterium]|nr:DNRLRE domain-containing protein [Verrucomicrobiota bacterium]
MGKLLGLGLIASGIIALQGNVAFGDSVTIGPSKDTMILGDSGALSDGAGSYMFSGRTGQTPAGISIRRALVAFDVAANVPTGSTITSAVLRLHMSRTPAGSGPHNVSLHRLTSNWGEAGSVSTGPEEGNGGPAQTGDATWTLAFFNTVSWTSSGGDFSAATSAVTSVNGIAAYTWSSAQMAADAQNWLDQPATNFGWIMAGNESASRSAKRFDSRENATTGNRPQLTIGYIPASADLELWKADHPDPLIVGSTLTYTITVTNIGPGSAENVTITDTLPSGLTPVGPTVTNVGALAPGSGLSIQIVVQVGTNTTGVITNQATVTTSSTETNTANNVAAEPTTIPDSDGDGEADFSDPDDDDDGIPDTYEIMFGLNPTNFADGVLDEDMDGFSNFKEYVSDTDPTNPASFFDIDSVGITNSVLLLFETSTGRVYTLKFTDDIESGIWSNFPGLINIPGTGTGTNAFLDSNDVPKRFYQINVDLP